jgi:hypothetical protein
MLILSIVISGFTVPPNIPIAVSVFVEAITTEFPEAS